MQTASLRATQGWARMATHIASAGPTLAELPRADASTLAPAMRPRSISVLPTVHSEGGEIQLTHETGERYRSAGVLGVGGMGIVERADDIDIGRPVAIKRLLPEASHAAGVARFVSEIRIVGSLDHPNVVPIHDVGVDADGRYFFVMKYVEGQTLADIIDSLAKGDVDALAFWTFERRAELMIAVLQALDYAHERGILHRDVKPENIMVGTHGEVRLMDWGIATRLGHPEPGESDTPGLIGTPAYMSPEQVGLEPLDARSDIYAAVVTMHEFFGLRHYLAHHADSMHGLLAAIQDEPADISGPATDGPQVKLPPELWHICFTGLHKDRAARYQSAGALIEDLRRYIDGRYGVKCIYTLGKRTLREGGRMIDRRPRVALALAATHIALALFGLGALIYLVAT